MITEKEVFDLIADRQLELNALWQKLDKFKPGVPYAYPLFKVHKLNEEDLKSKVIPPLRLVTDLHDGVTARSDKFIV